MLRSVGNRFEELHEEQKKNNKKVIVKPSTELISDEYDVPFDGTEHVHVFVAVPDLVSNCKKFLSDLNIEILDENIHKMDNCNEIIEDLEEACSAPSDTSLLFMLFWGYSKDAGEFTLEDDTTLAFYKIWSPFLSSRCLHLREKPKVFVFNVIKSIKSSESDGTHYHEPSTPFDVPGEADLLVVYKHNDNKLESITFAEALSDYLRNYGKTEDICSVVSIIDTFKYTRPVIISTLLKKLYMIPNSFRGHYLELEEGHGLALSEMNRINEILTNATQKRMQQTSIPFNFAESDSPLKHRSVQPPRISKTFTEPPKSKEEDKQKTSGYKIFRVQIIILVMVGLYYVTIHQYCK